MGSCGSWSHLPPIPMKYWNTMTFFTDQEKYYLNHYFKIIIILQFIILIYLNLDNIHTDHFNTLLCIFLW